MDVFRKVNIVDLFGAISLLNGSIKDLWFPVFLGIALFAVSAWGSHLRDEETDHDQ